MRIRNGFISNSSSTAFVLSQSSLTKKELDKVWQLTDLSDDLSRCTGRITNIPLWFRQFGPDIAEWFSEYETIKALMKQYDDLIIVRESDEHMGGSFADVKLSFNEISNKALLEWEYH